MNLVLLSFGSKIENHYQAAFSILSFLVKDEIEKVIVVTDNPEFYNLFKDKVEIIAINDQELESWKGKFNFFWRIKIKALETVINKNPNKDLLYVDSDTFLFGDTAAIKDGFSKGYSFMHIEEELLSKGNSKTVRNMWKVLQNKTFCGVEINSKSAMWNAGVIGLSQQDAKKIIKLSLSICDEICNTPCPRRLVEQLSFSMALNSKGQLRNCNSIIGHYWGNKKEWNEYIAKFFTTVLLKNLDYDQMLKEFQKIDLKQLPIIKKYGTTSIRLHNLINKVFQPKEIVFLD